MDTSSTLGLGQTISFSEISHAVYQIKGNWAQNTMQANMLSLHTLNHRIDPWVWVKRSIFFFYESGHVAYQIKLKKV